MIKLTEEAKVLKDIAVTCALACVAGQATVTITTRGKFPPGFPRGELLSVGTNGEHNYASHPVKVLAWLHSSMSKTHNAGGYMAQEAALKNKKNKLEESRDNIVVKCQDMLVACNVVMEYNKRHDFVEEWENGAKEKYYKLSESIADLERELDNLRHCLISPLSVVPKFGEQIKSKDGSEI